jgi:Immunoglobulin I-set domain
MRRIRLTPLDILSESKPLINRRMLGALALGATLSACGDGGGSAGTPPTIISEPQDAAVSEGETARFTVAAKDENQLSYQWFRNGVALVGASEKNLAFGGVRLSDHGAQFSVVLTNSGGSVQSRVARLKVQAMGEVVPSGWSLALPVFVQTTPVQFGLIAVGASSLVYAASDENERYVLKRYHPDGSAAGTFPLPRMPNTYTQISVVEEAPAGDVLIAVSQIAAAFINGYRAVGGGIYRLNPASGQLSTLFESDTISPSGLARDAAGNLYTVDLKTGDVLKLSAVDNQMAVLYRVNGEPLPAVGGIAYDFGFAAKGQVAVTSDGTIYATLVTGLHRASSAYGQSGAQSVRLRSAQADRIEGLGGAFGAYGNGLFFLSKSTLRKLDASGNVFTVAGTLGLDGQTQYGSPGTLSSSAGWIGLSPVGRVHLESKDPAGPRFFDIVLPADVS